MGKEDDVRNHPCLEGFQRYHIDKNLYLHPQCDNGSTIQKSLVRSQEVIVEEIAQEEDELMERNIEDDSSDKPASEESTQ
ncbi:hypothetical protein ALC56_00243 [Trachymyrmex septentrionalis]|uniref:Uncharacterized protein n=1 Tax=Trachymyrmex septentrionalis TaxID=34720 RepID=A0A151K1J8_9HYME|nr:hypothetical protein ALC56_00243 [Trachymyrmex septentrionalis]